MASNPQRSIRLSPLEHDPTGSGLSLGERTQAGLSVRANIACNCGELEQQVHSQPRDHFVTLTGFRFGLGRNTLRWTREPGSEVPFILVSGKVTKSGGERHPEVRAE